MFKRRTLLHRTVLVNLISGTAVSGVCSYETVRALVLRGATVHDGDTQSPADGEVLIDRSNVDFIQLL